ncbi:MAG: hypothetical protein WCS94_03550 [Verrucomicrobiota bacterium]
MSGLHAEQLKSLFDSLERCHTVLADAFPHEGLKAIGGSRVFLRDPLMTILKKCANAIAKELKDPAVGEVESDASALWVEFAELLTRIEWQDLKIKSEDEVNHAATLLYLANGVTWNCLRESVVDEPPHNPQYVRIEPLLPLLKRCGRKNEAEGITSKQIVQQLQAELKTCLR